MKGTLVTARPARRRPAIVIAAAVAAAAILVPTQVSGIPIDAWSPPEVRPAGDLFAPRAAGSYFAYNGETIVDAGVHHSYFCGTGKTFSPSDLGNPGWNFGGPDPADAVYVSSSTTLTGGWSTSGKIVQAEPVPTPAGSYEPPFLPVPAGNTLRYDQSPCTSSIVKIGGYYYLAFESWQPRDYLVAIFLARSTSPTGPFAILRTDDSWAEHGVSALDWKPIVSPHLLSRVNGPTWAYKWRASATLCNASATTCHSEDWDWVAHPRPWGNAYWGAGIPRVVADPDASDRFLLYYTDVTHRIDPYLFSSPEWSRTDFSSYPAHTSFSDEKRLPSSLIGFKLVVPVEISASGLPIAGVKKFLATTPADSVVESMNGKVWDEGGVAYDTGLSRFMMASLSGSLLRIRTSTDGVVWTDPVETSLPASPGELYPSPRILRDAAGNVVRVGGELQIIVPRMVDFWAGDPYMHKAYSRFSVGF